MSRNFAAKKLAILAVLLILAGVPTALLAFSNSPGNHSLNPNPIKQPVTGRPQLGFDCGLGTVEAVANATGIPVSNSENGAFQTLPSCTWIGDAGQTVSTAYDGTNEPLVSDQDELLSTIPGSPGGASIGGGFTADVVYIQNATSTTNGFDLTINWNPKVIQLAKFEQGGLPWTSNNPFTGVFALDNTVGQLHVVQVIFSALGGDFIFFHLRFDVVGVGSTGLTISNDVITNPNSVVHQTINGAFNSEAFWDPTNTLHWVASFTNSTPINPGGSNSFAATVSGGTPPYTYAWDFNVTNTSVFTAQNSSSTSTVTRIMPVGSTISGNRIDLRVTDSAAHSIDVVQRLPLTVSVGGPRALTRNLAATFPGAWLGGISPYLYNWRLCPGTLTIPNVVCTLPAPGITAPIGIQTNTRAVTYHFAGVYTDSLKVTDTAAPPISSSGNSVTFLFFANVTGGPLAYTLTLTSNVTSIVTNKPVLFTAVAHYASNYTISFRSTTINVKFLFGDGGSTTSTITMATGGANTTSVVHNYIAGGSRTALAVGQDTGISAIQETSNRIAMNIIPVISSSFTWSPFTPQVGQTVTFTAGTTTGGTAPYTFTWNFNDTGTATGSVVTHTFLTAPAHGFNVTMTVTDSGTPSYNVQTTTILNQVTVTAATFAFTLAATPSTLPITAGGAGGVETATATLTAGSTTPVTFSVLTALPTGVTASVFTPASCSPTCSATVTFTASASAPASSTVITIQAVGGGVTQTATFTLQVTASFAFTLAASPSSLSITDGGAGGVETATATLTSGTTTPVTFSILTALPTGVTAIFLNNPCSPTCSSTITFSAAANAPASSTVITIQASGGSPTVTHTATFTLVVSGFFDFTLAASPASLSITDGAAGGVETATATLNASATTSPVTFSILTVSGLTLRLSL